MEINKTLFTILSVFSMLGFLSTNSLNKEIKELKNIIAKLLEENDTLANEKWLLEEKLKKKK